MVSTKKPHLNSMNNSNNKSDLQTDTIYTKKATSFALIVKPSTTIEQRNGLTNYDSDEEFERTKQISNKVLVRRSIYRKFIFMEYLSCYKKVMMTAEVQSACF
jgi:hypothetical protein